ncbi:hypothetical protein, partial [Limosilactobacillus gastricus]|uniref:hypothetical protein n=1 Tax=Limosilactobacillus gastricus TaxID=227942 RepID=UPI00058E73A8
VLPYSLLDEIYIDQHGVFPLFLALLLNFIMVVIDFWGLFFRPKLAKLLGILTIAVFMSSILYSYAYKLTLIYVSPAVLIIGMIVLLGISWRSKCQIKFQYCSSFLKTAAVNLIISLVSFEAIFLIYFAIE